VERAALGARGSGGAGCAGRSRASTTPSRRQARQCWLPTLSSPRWIADASGPPGRWHGRCS